MLTVVHMSMISCNSVMLLIFFMIFELYYFANIWQLSKKNQFFFIGASLILLVHLHFCLFYLRGSRKLIVSNRSMFSPKLKFECILGSIHVCKTHCDFNMKPMYVFVLFWSADAFCAFPYRLQVSLSFLGVGCLSCFFISCSFVLCTAGPL